EVHLADSTSELVRDRRHGVLRDRVDGLSERVTGLERIGKQRQCVAELVVEGLQPAPDPELDVHAGHQVPKDSKGDDLDDAARKPEPEQPDQHEQNRAAELDHEVLGSAELEVGPTELLGNGGLAFLGITAADALRGRRKDAVEGVAEAGRRWQLAGARGGDAIRRQPGLEVLSAARGAPGLVQPDEEQEDAGEGEKGEYRADWHVGPPGGVSRAYPV